MTTLIRLKRVSIACAVFISASPLYASDFTMPFVNGSDLGNAYSAWAVAANDASTTYTNPAGLVNIKSTQVVGSAIGVAGRTQFRGTATTLGGTTQTGSTTGTLGGFLPLFYVSTPINNKMVFGFGVNAPFGLSTMYDKDSVARYAATRSQILAVDFMPSVGYRINDKISIGIGFDAERLTFKLDNMIGTPFSVPDAEAQNHLAGWGYGWHGGILYQVLPTTRIGVSYNSQIMFHTSGDSEVFGNSGEMRTTLQRANMALPARAQISLSQDITSRWTTMASVFYTRWSILNQLTLKNTMLFNGFTTSITIPFQYHDTFDYAIGVSFKATEKWKFQAGVQYLNSPSTMRDRSPADPVSYMTLVSVGARYEQNPHLTYDLGLMHDFFRPTTIRYNIPTNTLNGKSNSNSNIIGLQVAWTA